MGMIVVLSRRTFHRPFARHGNLSGTDNGIKIRTRHILKNVFGEKPATQIEEALRKFKQVMETGEIATTTGEQKLPHSMEPVEAASEDSFPASDAPAWTGTTGPVG